AALARPPLPRAAPGRPPKLTRAAWLASRAPPPMRAPPPRLWLAAGVAAACCGRARASGAGAGDPLDGARQAVAGRLRRLQAQQAVEAGPAALCVSQKAECARNIARTQAVEGERARAVRAAGGDADGCISGALRRGPMQTL
ncbi:unnamed protein product, partial [Prorocentrum cordatum]